MGVIQISDHVYQLELPLVNVFLLELNQELVLIDVGPYKSKRLLYQLICETGRDPLKIAHIVITHAHYDHTGALSAIKKDTNARVYMQADDASLVSKGIAWQPTNAIASFLMTTFTLGGKIKFPFINIKPVTADEFIESGTILLNELLVITAPGHWKNQVVLLMQSDGGLLFAADSAENISGLKLSSENQDRRIASSSLKKLSALDFSKAVFSHGKPIISSASEIFRKTFG
ncbi:MBL fold metallo-hydrolase [Pedobacter sp. HMF7647]|uniref:MBL fold metallo-hydrolase n=1 Tax=Hufsiella arboris TaxID=2695275 RepID=A0A7K1Y8I1_9SPHI|nr:MBL fold metallo-hydrolase [Hufsiella arboris]MXV50681.1 MBL fold metallo-hydrolase [Hufsiella arboris]